MTSVQEPVSVREPIAADEAELATLRELRALLISGEAESFVLVGGEREAALTPTALFFLRLLIEQLANERAVRMETFGREVTPEEAADILNESSKHVRELIAEGTLVARVINDDEVVNLQLIKLTDLRAYLHERSKRRREAINDLLRLSEEFGLYERDIRVEDEAAVEER